MVGAAARARCLLYDGAGRSPAGQATRRGSRERAHLPPVHPARGTPRRAAGASEEGRDRPRRVLPGPAPPPALFCVPGPQGRQLAPRRAGVARSHFAAHLPRAHPCAARSGGRCDPRILSVKRLKIGVVGAGAWGRNHVRTVAGLAEGELAAVCDTDPRVRERLSRQYPGALVTGDMAALLAAVDAVIVASPATTHAAVAQQVLEAGKPVLVEKPFSLSVADAEAVAEQGAQRRGPVPAGHPLLYHPGVPPPREPVQTGGLGKG